MTGTETRAILDAYYKALQSGDEARLRALLADDIVVHYHDAEGLLPWGGEWKGYDGFRRFLATVSKHLSVDEVSPQEYHIAADSISVVLNGRWTVRATGRQVAATVANIFTMQGGKITRYQVFPDSAAFALGLAKISLT
ncbi:MAG: hypothetical protein EP348_11550 [Alphaproteobacteria bacterium]|nr:MAG: hypothetical protein EP348_11550 [Alphaproteobacteria bacterium]